MICDCHAHIIGPAPHDADWPHDTPEAPLADYLATLDANGVSHGVLVQPRAAGFDNSLIAGALAAHPDRLRGVAVVPPDVPVDRLRALARQGFRGVRLGGKVPVSALPVLGPKLAAAGLHAQLLMFPPALLAAARDIAESPVPVVIDHFAHPDPADGFDGDAWQTLTGLLEHDHVHAKMSAVFRWAKAPGWADAQPFFRAMTQRFPARLVWGSDWPFLNQGARPPDYPDLLAFFRDACADGTSAGILSGNARRLYGF